MYTDDTMVSLKDVMHIHTAPMLNEKGLVGWSIG